MAHCAPSLADAQHRHLADKDNVHHVMLPTNSAIAVRSDCERLAFVSAYEQVVHLHHAHASHVCMTNRGRMG